jgi:hypothetical protein
MEIGSLSTEGIGSDYRLGLKAVSADGTAKLDLTQCRHDTLFHRFQIATGNICAILKVDHEKLSLLLEISG